MTEFNTQANSRPRELTGTPKFVVDFAPLIAFFAANWYFGTKGAINPIGGKPIIAATAIFMVAMAMAMIYSWSKTRPISPMMWLTAAIVAIFGGLTIWLKNDLFIKLRPTIVNSLFGILLLGAYWLGRNPLKALLGEAFPPLTEKGWRIFTYLWGGFFFASAALNEILRRMLSDNWYVAYTTWGDMVVTFGFLLLTLPVVMRYAADEKLNP